MPTAPTDRNVYILGAGFSASAGVPLIRNFLDRAREFYDDPSSGLLDFERSEFSRVFEFKRRMAQAREKVRIDLDDIEQLFGLAEISYRLKRVHRETRDSTVYLIAKTIQLSMIPWGSRGKIGFCLPSTMIEKFRLNYLQDVFNLKLGSSSNEVDVLVDLYDFFACLVAGIFDSPEKRSARKDCIITFNYDLLCDHALTRLGVTPYYHLAYQQKFIDRNKAITLLKLHGSTNWGICSNCKDQVIIEPDLPTDTPLELRNRDCASCGTPNYVPLLIPPSWDKTEYREILEPVWAKAVEELSSATRICIIGYSMPEVDAFFKYLLTLALSENHQLYRLIVVDSNKPVPAYGLGGLNLSQGTSVEKRYRRLLDRLFRERRFACFGEGLAMFLGNLASLRILGRAEDISRYIHLY